VIDRDVKAAMNGEQVRNLAPCGFHKVTATSPCCTVTTSPDFSLMALRGLENLIFDNYFGTSAGGWGDEGHINFSGNLLRRTA
jgi:hypothetical protein